MTLQRLIKRRFRKCLTTLAAGGALTIAVGHGPVSANDFDDRDDSSIPIATGSRLNAHSPRGPFFYISNYGAVSGGPAVANQTAINNAIRAAAQAGGGTVVVPSGDFKTYTIHLASNVGLLFASEDSVLRAAVPGTSSGQDGGFYDAAETNPFIGLQDEGHSHWNNSLIVGVDVHDIMISGPGLIDGSYLGPDGKTVTVLTSGDPPELTVRTAQGSPGGANKAIALKNAENVVFRDFKIKYGGHFAILGTGVRNWMVDGLVVDTNRDGIDVDASQDVTVRNSTFNSINDDALVLKASFALGRYVPTKNVLIEHCTVSGYDTGSVLAGVYGTQQLAPTARIKLGTEATGGFDTVTIRDVEFDRSRGFAVETVDGAELKNVVFSNATMKNVSMSPIFLVLGDRGRAPVTGNSTDQTTSPANTVRLDDLGFVLPDLLSYGTFPAVRYMPSYNRNQTATIGGGTSITVVNQTTPTRLNSASVRPNDPLYANAVGVGVASLKNVRINNVNVVDADPRFPVTIAGLVDHPVQNVSISNVSIQYRGGMKILDAVENRQISIKHTYTAYQRAQATQTIQYNGGANEILLPRIGWEPQANGGMGAWVNDPYNVPEGTREYPEPNQFGILPAYGMYVRHVQGLRINNVRLSYATDDERPPVVLDDVYDGRFTAFTAMAKVGTPQFVFVTRASRQPELEFVLNQPYRLTTVRDVITPPGVSIQRVTLARPAPGTPPDSLYRYPTVPSATYPYAYAIPNASYSLPPTIFPGLDP